MVGECVIYQGRNVPKKGFRVFVYGQNGTKKLSNSWEEYNADIGTGIWFSLKENVPQQIIQQTEPQKPFTIEKSLKKKGRK